MIRVTAVGRRGDLRGLPRHCKEESGEKFMRKTTLTLLASAAFAVLAFAGPTSAQTALTGLVVSAEEGAMEGVLVTAKKDGSTISITVVTDAQGRYSFPAAKLDPGRYTLRIRAVGYDLEGKPVAEVAAGGPATADLKLRKARNISAQLTNAEWIESTPGTREQKDVLFNCVSCHSLERIVKSTHDADGFVDVMTRMGTYANQSVPMRPQKRLAQRLLEERGEQRAQALKRRAEWLATVNLSEGSTWEYALKTLPRPKGRATKVIITEYDLPRPLIEPHDVILDKDVNAWYSNFGEQNIGKLDPKTGKVTTYSLPPEMNKDMAQVNMVRAESSAVDGKVWSQNNGFAAIHRLDLATGNIETIEPFKNSKPGETHNIYDIVPDSQNNVYFTDFAQEHVGRVDAKTGKITLYEIPTKKSAPRRGMMDSEDRMWFGEYRGNRIAMFDTKTEKFTEWQLPLPWAAPYEVTIDRNAEAWTGSMMNDRVTRLNTKTGEFVDYLLPRSTNIRRVYVDNTTTPVTFWVGSNHGASIIKLEPLD